MKNKKEIVIALRIAIIVFAMAGVAFCAYWVPSSLQKIYASFPWLEAAFYWLCSLPCFVILFLAYKVTDEFAAGRIFEEKPAKYVELAGWILGTDSLLFIIGNIVVYFVKPNGFEFFYWFLGVEGICLSILFIALERYIKGASEVEKENEAII
jgi:hypothetical protein